MPGLTRINTQVGPARKALLIGIKYSGDNELKSTYADVEQIRALLIDVFKYNPHDITTLMDDGKSGITPTRDNIFKAIQDLVRDAKEGDHFVFHFSGHGSQQPELKADSEKDHMDEAIWPADVKIERQDGQITRESNVILDNDIRAELVDKLPPRARLVLIFDCCHSGTAADLEHVHSDHYKGPKLGFANAVLVKMQSSKSLVPGVIEADPRSPFSAITPGCLKPELLDTRAVVVSWAACRDLQTTLSKSEGGGMFIESFVHALKTLLDPKNDNAQNVTHQEVHHLVTRSMDIQTTVVRKSIHKLVEKKAQGLVDYNAFRERIAVSRPQFGSSCDHDMALQSTIMSMFGHPQ